MFRNYHYLDHNLNYASRVFIGYINNDPCCFVGVLPQPGILPNLFRIHRCVVLPDFQGLGLVTRMNEYIGELYYISGKRLSIVTTHPGLIKSYYRSKKWKLKNIDDTIKVTNNFDKALLSNRLKASFIYIPNNFKDDWSLL